MKEKRSSYVVAIADEALAHVLGALYFSLEVVKVLDDFLHVDISPEHGLLSDDLLARCRVIEAFLQLGSAVFYESI